MITSFFFCFKFQVQVISVEDRSRPIDQLRLTLININVVLDIF